MNKVAVCNESGEYHIGREIHQPLRYSGIKEYTKLRISHSQPNHDKDFYT